VEKLFERLDNGEEVVVQKVLRREKEQAALQISASKCS
jgi:hypothetical protein